MGKWASDHNTVRERLCDAGLSPADALLALGVLCEYRMRAEIDGVKRGYNNGYAEARAKYEQVWPTVAEQTPPVGEYVRVAANERTPLHVPLGGESVCSFDGVEWCRRGASWLAHPDDRWQPTRGPDDD